MSDERSASAASAEVFKQLATLLYTCEDFDEVYQAICAAAPQMIDGCDHASMLLKRGADVVTVGASDEVARYVDELELALGEGPCLDAIVDEAAHLDSDITNGCPWPQLGAELLASTPVRGMAGFRLLLDDQKVGALNTFSDHEGALTAASMDQAAVLTAFASVTVTAMRQQREASTLLAGFESNREIGIAVGLLMAFHRVDRERALEIMRQASQDMNIKLAEIARQIVDHENDRPRP